jgi:hypothetical protein
MAESIKFDDLPRELVKNQVQAYREGFIPGSKLIIREWSSDGQAVFFHMPMSISRRLDRDEIEELKDQVRGWWESKTTDATSHPVDMGL